MSELIDNLVRSHSSAWPQQQIGYRWYFAKAYQYHRFRYRIKNAWLVLTGKAIAVHYAVDDPFINPRKKQPTKAER